MKITDIAQNGQERFKLSDPTMVYQKIADLTKVSSEGNPETNQQLPTVHIDIATDMQAKKQEQILKLIGQLLELI